MVTAAIKILFVAGAAYWVFSGNRSIELMAFYGAAIALVGYDFTGLQREKSLLDRPPKRRPLTMFDKLLDGILILVLGGLGIYVLVN